MRLLVVFAVLALLVLIPFAIWGDALEAFFTQQAAVDWLANYGYWGWAVGMLLLGADLLIPLPATVIMAALGILYGPWLGGLIGAFGSLIAGTVGYEACRKFGENTARKLLGNKDWEKAKKLDHKVGGALVVLSRWTPVLPEVVACMAGLIRMERTKFYLALGVSSFPLAWAYAWAGFAGSDFPLLTLVLSALLPLLLWLLIRDHLKRKLYI